jgi:hypothetical protein
MRDFLSRHVFSPLQGMTAGAWWSLLRQNRCAIDPPYWPRASFQSAISLHNSAFARLEDAIHGPSLDATQVEPPLFIVGHFIEFHRSLRTLAPGPADDRARDGLNVSRPGSARGHEEQPWKWE